jgi:hypothetical protein
MAYEIVDRNGRLRKEHDKRYGRLTIIHAIAERGKPLKMKVVCDCSTIKDVHWDNLKGDKTTSCGCVHREATIRVTLTHGHSRVGKISDEYRCWLGMIQRCTNSNVRGYPDYGGRGIKVCERWLNSFENFFEDMGQRPSKSHSLDRFPNNDGDYKPGNCRWATKLEQMSNKRSNRLIDYQGELLCLAEWARRTGIRAETITSRLKKGWSIERALSLPAKHVHILKGRFHEKVV